MREPQGTPWWTLRDVRKRQANATRDETSSRDSQGIKG